MAEPYQITAKDFILGESQSAYIADRGFSPTSYGLNLTKERGALYFKEASTDRGSTTLTGNLVAKGKDSDTANDQYFVDDEAAFYTLLSATFTKQFTGVNTYTLGTTDIKNFAGSGSELMYVSSQTAIAQCALNFATVTENWWTGLTSSYRHPLEEIEGELFIADGNIIYFWNGTTSGTAFTLPAGKQVTTMRRHPDGKTLIAFATDKANYSHTAPSEGYAYFCDPSIRDWTREIKLESQVEGTRLVGGVLLCSYGTTIGYFNGDGLSFLKKQATSGTTYSQSMDNMDDIFLVRDGPYVLAFGDLGAGKVWWKMVGNVGLNNLNIVMHKGDSVILFAGTDGAGGGTLYEVDMKNSGSDGVFRTNQLNFGGEAKVKRIDLYHDATNTAGTTTIQLATLDDSGSLATIEDRVHVNQNVKFDRFDCDVKVQGTSQFFLNPQNDDIGYRVIRIYYDPV